MIRVIDSIRFDEQSLQSDSNFAEKVGPGLLVTIDVMQSPSPFVKPGSMVRIYRPDGTIINRVVGAVEIWGPKVGLYFPNTQQYQIPTSSEIELLT